MAVVMHFSTFLKFLTLDTGDKIRQLQSYASPGGFDFYRPSRVGVRLYCSGTSDRHSVSARILQSPGSGAQQNLEIFSQSCMWLDKQKGQRLLPTKAIWHSPGRFFSVHIEPEIAIDCGDHVKVIAVYPRKNSRLNRDKAGAAILLLQEAYPGHGTERYGVLDTYAQKAFWAPTNVSAALLSREIETIAGELRRIMS